MLYSHSNRMVPSVFKWTDFALGHSLRLASIVLIALILNRLLRTLTRRLIPAAGAEGLGRIARMREQHTKTLAGLLYSAGTAVIMSGAILTALPEFGFNITPIAAVAGLASLAFGFGAQHLVRDLINGFFVVVEDQFVVGETGKAPWSAFPMARSPRSRISAGIGASSLWTSPCLPAVRRTPRSRRWNACPGNSERILPGHQFWLTGRASSESNRLGRAA
jgi:hypothetical protein